jgi:hypothetical protein
LFALFSLFGLRSSIWLLLPIGCFSPLTGSFGGFSSPYGSFVWFDPILFGLALLYIGLVLFGFVRLVWFQLDWI